MQELAVRAHLHSAALGQRAALDVAIEMARDIDNPALARAARSNQDLGHPQL